MNLLGVDENDLIGVKISNIIGPIDHYLVTKKIGNNDFAYSKIFHFINASGKKFLAEFNLALVELDNKNYCLINFLDITDHMNNKAQLELQEKKLREIGYIHSHLFRSPISRILAIVEALEDESLNEKERLIYLKSIGQSAKELDELLRGIVSNLEQTKLDFSLQPTFKQ